MVKSLIVRRHSLEVSCKYVQQKNNNRYYYAYGAREKFWFISKYMP